MKTTLAKFTMKIFPYHMSINDRWAKYTSEYIQGDKDKALQSSQFRYDYEISNDFIRTYFPDFNTSEFKNKSLFELGSFTGGALVRWVEAYGFAEAKGIDVKELYAEAGNAFAAKMNFNIQFNTGFGENLPYEDNSFDFVFTHDVLEHVRSVEKTMSEILRVLKPGGKLFCVFPQFMQPLESHLTFATHMPALHWFFSGKVLAKAYSEILIERGKDADWYAPSSYELDGWEKLPTLNGITISRFRDIIKSDSQWQICREGKKPILSDGRRAKLPFYRFLRLLFYIPARVPILEEFFRGRINYILEKRSKL